VREIFQKRSISQRVTKEAYCGLEDIALRSGTFVSQMHRSYAVQQPSAIYEPSDMRYVLQAVLLVSK
jgi:hypothetical protein